MDTMALRNSTADSESKSSFIPFAFVVIVVDARVVDEAVVECEPVNADGAGSPLALSFRRESKVGWSALVEGKPIPLANMKLAEVDKSLVVDEATLVSEIC